MMFLDGIDEQHACNLAAALGSSCSLDTGKAQLVLPDGNVMRYVR